MCDGREMDTRLPLFEVIGHLYGEANGVDKFCLPDYRGRFLRGVDDPTGKIRPKTIQMPNRAKLSVPT
ncbi:MAG: phage tail protein [Parasphingorhabdus sp.]